MKTTPTPPARVNAPVSTTSSTSSSSASPQLRPSVPSAGSSSSSVPHAFAGAQVSQAEPPSSWFRTLARAAVTFVNDVEDMLFPVHLLRSSGAQQLPTARPSVADGKSVTAAPEVRRGGAAAMAMKQLDRWCTQNSAASFEDRATIFTDDKSKALRDTLARAVHGDCGDTLRAIALRCVAAVAGAAKDAAAKKRPLSSGQLQVLMVKAFRAEFGEVTQRGIGSPALWKFMLDVSAQVSQWESGTCSDLPATSHAVPNLLVACGLAAAARDLATAASATERPFYEDLARLTPALAGATHPMQDSVVEMQAALEITGASSDVMSYCARQVVAAGVEERRKLGDSKAHGASQPVVEAGQPGRSRTPSTALEHQEPSQTDFLTSSATLADD